jgi:hypothetical protein
MKKVYLLLFFPALALAQSIATTTDAIPNTPEEAIGAAQTLWDFFVTKQYAALVGPGLALGIYVLREYDTKIPKIGATIDKFLNQPFVAFSLPTVVAAVGGLATAIAAGKPIPEAVKPALELAGSAIVTYIGVKKAKEQMKPALTVVPEVKP